MTDTHKQVTQHPRQRCYFCGSEGPIETHHIVPSRHGGSDDETNLVDLCPTCHQRLEALYDQRYFGELGVVNDDADADSDVTSKTQRDRIKALKSAINEIEKEHQEGAPIEIAIDHLTDKFDAVDREQAADAIEKLRRKGQVYEPKQDHLRTT